MTKVFTGVYRADEEQLTPKKEGEPPSAASQGLVDRWIAVLEKIAEREEAEEKLFVEVRAHKPPE
jgi:hypothetical protein